MNNPYNEIFDTVIELSKQQGYATFDYLPDDEQGYPFVFIGSQQNIDQLTKDRTLGQTHLQIDAYGTKDQRHQVTTILDKVLQAVYEDGHTEHYQYNVTNSQSRLLSDVSTDIPLWHGVL